MARIGQLLVACQSLSQLLWQRGKVLTDSLQIIACFRHVSSGGMWEDVVATAGHCGCEGRILEGPVRYSSLY